MTDIDQLADEFVEEAEENYLVLPQLSVAVRRWLGTRTTDEARAL
ncbi:MAG TPA: hypothetical protein VFQ82_11310 [Stellaceae bacterium]|nr:hypothetical protein [Stellaceae bacterium]